MSGKISALLLEESANNRHGLAFAPQEAELSASDISDIFHVGVPSSVSNPWQSASGGVARNLRQARLAAIAESIERYTARMIELPLQSKQQLTCSQRLDPEEWTLFSPRQRAEKNFPFGNLYGRNLMYTNVRRLSDNAEVWVPHSLVALRDDYQTGIPTSSGLAAGSSLYGAFQRALEELIERDALMATWLHCLPGREIPLRAELVEQVTALAGTVRAFDLTPDYSPLPVIAVVGSIPKRGGMRYSLGVACRPSLVEASEKAFLEWCQGVYFAGVYLKHARSERLKYPDDVKTFDDHAIYYTQHPKDWARLPLMEPAPVRRVVAELTGDCWQIIARTAESLTAAGIRLYYRDLTTIDSLQAGIRVVKAMSPDLIPINSHHSWPFLGGNARKLDLRYADLRPGGAFPNKFPHPLG